MMIIFEGPDGSGKDTLRHRVSEHPETRGVITCVARAWASQLTYARLANRELWTDDDVRAGFTMYARRAIDATFALHVHLTATAQVLVERLAGRDGRAPETMLDPKWVDECYQESYRFLGIDDARDHRLLWLDTSRLTVDETTEIVLTHASKFLKKEMKRWKTKKR